ncbi:HrpF/NolX family T3SS translocon protein, partial [Ralstonia pseudosolanacearum]
TGGGGEVGKADFLQAASSAMSLTQPELDTLKTINANQNAFFGNGDLTRDKLASMADNKQLDPKVRQAAKQLLGDPVLFGLLNNAITGYKTHHG